MSKKREKVSSHLPLIGVQLNKALSGSFILGTHWFQ